MSRAAEANDTDASGARTRLSSRALFRVDVFGTVSSATGEDGRRRRCTRTSHRWCVLTAAGPRTATPRADFRLADSRDTWLRICRGVSCPAFADISKDSSEKTAYNDRRCTFSTAPSHRSSAPPSLRFGPIRLVTSASANPPRLVVNTKHGRRADIRRRRSL